MKKKYEKPELDLIDLLSKEALMDDIIGRQYIEGYNDFNWDTSNNLDEWG